MRTLLKLTILSLMVDSCQGKFFGKKITIQCNHDKLATVHKSMVWSINIIFFWLFKWSINKRSSARKKSTSKCHDYIVDENSILKTTQQLFLSNSNNKMSPWKKLIIWTTASHYLTPWKWVSEVNFDSKRGKVFRPEMSWNTWKSWKKNCKILFIILWKNRVGEDRPKMTNVILF